jgi:hypothetical protein
VNYVGRFANGKRTYVRDIRRWARGRPLLAFAVYAHRVICPHSNRETRRLELIGRVVDRVYSGELVLGADQCWRDAHRDLTPREKAEQVRLWWTLPHLGNDPRAEVVELQPVATARWCSDCMSEDLDQTRTCPSCHGRVTTGAEHAAMLAKAKRADELLGTP